MVGEEAPHEGFGVDGETPDNGGGYLTHTGCRGLGPI